MTSNSSTVGIDILLEGIFLGARRVSTHFTKSFNEWAEENNKIFKTIYHLKLLLEKPLSLFF